MRSSDASFFCATPVCRLFPAFLLLLLSACGPSQSLQQTNTDSEEQAGISQAESDRLESLFWARQEASRDQFTSADEQFMVGMIAHHSQALIMTELARANNAGDGVLQMSKRIENTQYDEIATMQQWLRDRGLPVPIVTIDGLDMSIEMETADGVQHESDRMHHDMETDSAMNGGMHPDSSDAVAHHHRMPGMLTQEQLVRMADATENAFDELFLRYMIEHHEGAIYMVQELLASGGAAQHPETFRLASDIHADQEMEIERMKQMLQAMGAPLIEPTSRTSPASIMHDLPTRNHEQDHP